MRASRRLLLCTNLSIFTALVLLLFCTLSAADTAEVNGVKWISYTEPDGTTIWLNDDRRPALYTADFGDCGGGSLINVTRFDAAYYADNMTILFHLAGNSALTNESLMLYIGVFAYGEDRFNLTFNPCNANINSLCPLNSSIPIEASAIIPVAPEDVAGIPLIALSIPDFEGEAILRIFANSTESQIACFSAVVTNGASFSHPAAVGSALGAMTLIALLASVATTIYGQYVPETRKHYAHSISMLVVFSVFHHIYFTGALSMNWPSVLVAFWNNYAWSAGMIYSASMQKAIEKFLGGDLGNIGLLGSAANGEDTVGWGGGFEISQIYKRSLASRDLVNSSSGFSWYGSPVRAGLPLPGNFSGFAGTLDEQGIPASNAFTTGLIWFLVLLGLITCFMISLKWAIEGLFRARLLKSEHLSFFREHWLAFTGAALLRTCFIAFFMMIYLTLFQFAFNGPAGVIAVAALVFAIFFAGLLGCALYAILYRIRSERFKSEPDRPNLEPKKLGFIPWYGFTRESKSEENDEARTVSGSLSWWRLRFVGEDSDRLHVHDDEVYTRRFGWLTSRFRRSRWWFFSFWLVYEFVRACFYGAAIGHPLTQVFGLLVVEIIALVVMVIMKPFESNRLNLLMIYLLGFSKVATVALSSAFIERFNQPRILTTVIGVVIIVIQGVLTICLLIAIVLGIVSSYMSITRHREEIKPKSWMPWRVRYFNHVDQKATDRPRPVTPPPPPMPERPAGPYFAVAAVRREPKIEDDDHNNENHSNDFENYMASEQAGTELDQARPASRTHSMRSRTSASNLPYGARRHRASWSTRDFQDQVSEQEDIPSGMHSRVSMESVHDATQRHRSSSLRGPSRNATLIPPVPSRIESIDGASDDKRRHRRSTSGTQQQRPKLPRQATTVNEEHEEGDDVESPKT